MLQTIHDTHLRLFRWTPFTELSNNSVLDITNFTISWGVKLWLVYNKNDISGHNLSSQLYKTIYLRLLEWG